MVRLTTDLSAETIEARGGRETYSKGWQSTVNQNNDEHSILALYSALWPPEHFNNSASFVLKLIKTLISKKADNP